MQQILTKCLEDTRFSFEIVGKNVVISLKKQPDVKLIEISGKVVDENGNSVPGATVLIQGTSQGVVTNIDNIGLTCGLPIFCGCLLLVIRQRS